MKVSVSPSVSNLRPVPKLAFVIDKETLQHLDPIEQLAALMAIRRGYWHLID
jgi:hypothetical protein